MRRLKERTVEQGIEHHKQNGVRVYRNDGVQDGRIAKARLYVEKTLAALAPGRKTIAELGCGVLDISGAFSGFHEVIGRDCNEACVNLARADFPNAVVSVGPLEELDPFPCDILVLCEILEHLEDPLALVRKWLPHVRASVISHPIDGDIEGDLSGGDHCWTYKESDLSGWFEFGGHDRIESEIFAMGSYRIGIARGFRRGT